MSNPSIEEIFEIAVNLPTPQERAAYLRGACGDNPSLKEQVESLLDAQDETPGFMPTEPGEPTITIPDRPLSEGPGAVIDRYKLLQNIGEGGMGAVFMAEQTEPVRRKVALKIIKLGMDTKSVVARFEAERQALALMDHPSIAKVLDAGSTETGRPYFVMELVKGVSINTYCDKNHLPTRERLELFAQVCQSIQHAHQKGVIHRDIKPSNILVTLHDGKPVPKVIDFGIAKATNHRLTEKTLFTNFAQMIGTPAYMSPEQAEMSGLDVDTRTDVYSLGVLLYELLTGSLPFPEKELLSKGYGEMQRIIAEQEPDRPSSRMSTIVGEQQTIVAKNRGGALSLLTKQLRGDLDWIVMKSLEKDRTRRYDTANGLAEDIHRHLSDEPVSAARPSWRYQIAKSVRRNKPAFAAGLAITLVLIVASVVATLAAIREKRAKEAAIDMQEKAESMKETAETLNQFLFDEFIALGAPSKTSTRSLTLLDALENLEGRVSEYFAGRPELEIEARMAIGRAFLFRFDRERTQVHLSRAYELCRETYGDVAPETLEAGRAYLYGFLGVSGARPGWSAISERLYDHTRQLYDASDPRHYLSHGFLAFNKAFGINGPQNLSEAINIMQEPLRLHAEIRAVDPFVAALNLNLLGVLDGENGDTIKAERYLRRAIEEFTDYGGESYPLALWTRSYLGQMAREHGEIEKAIREFELIVELGPDIFMNNEFLTSVSQDLIKLYFYTDEKEKAESLGRRILAEGASEFDLEQFLVTQAYGSVQSMSHQEARESRAWERVLEDLQAIPVESGKDRIPLLIANCYYHLGDIEANYTALTNLPLDGSIYYSSSEDSAPFLLRLRAMNRARAGKWSEAKEEINQALSRQPDYADAQFVAALVSLNLNDVPEWKSHCSTLIDGFEGLGQQLKLWTLLSCLGQQERLPEVLRLKAVNAAETAYAVSTEDESAKYRSTRVLLGGLAAWSEGRLEEAIDRLSARPYREALRPINLGFDWERHQWRRESAQQLLLANCYARLGRAQEAQGHLKQSNEVLERISYDWWESVLLKRLQDDTVALIEAARK